jgi:ribosomal protein S18 acetylase RimI-like enzyme
MSADSKTQFISGNEALLDMIAPLWEQLIQHHLERTTVFRFYYESLTFAKRKAVLLKKARRGELHVELATDTAEQLVGYIVSTFNKEEKLGEVDSVCISKPYRHRNVGSTLMQKTLAWMDNKGAEKKIVDVAVGNEDAFNFYSKFGFLPRKTVLEQKK